MTDSALSIDAATRSAIMFKALGDPTRVRLLSLIAAHEGGAAYICDLTEPAGLTQGTLSHHMKPLADAGLVNREQRGKCTYYRVKTETFTSLPSMRLSSCTSSRF